MVDLRVAGLDIAEGTSPGGISLRVVGVDIGGNLVATQLQVSGIDIAMSKALVNAGSDRSDIEPLSTVTLDGVASGGTTFAWTLVSATNGVSVTIENNDMAVARYVAPAHVNGAVLTFRLTVDGTSTDDVVHTVFPHTLWYYTGTVWEAA